MSRLFRFSAPLLLGASVLLPSAQASTLPPLLPVAAQAPFQAQDLPSPTTRNGQEIFQRFRAGLANAQCDSEASSERWKQQFRHAGQRLADPDDPLLPLFGYVVDELYKAGLPTEFALIPFVESGYRPGATSKAGPAGLWQFITSTARHHKVPMSGGVDGRLSATESTAAAVQYLKTLHGIFDGRWELTVMGYNAGEYRILQALRRSGLNASNAPSQSLAGLSPVTYRYVEKLHALSCVMEEAADNGSLLALLDREVPILTEVILPAGTNLAQLPAGQPLAMQTINQLNPLLARGKASRALGALVPASTGMDLASAADSLRTTAITRQEPADRPIATPQTATTETPAVAASASTTARTVASPRRHTVRTGESLWAIARRHGLAVNTLLALNKLEASSVLRPGTELLLD